MIQQVRCKLTGGTLLLPPLNVDNGKHYFGEVKRFPWISDLVKIIEHGVPMVTSSTPSDPRQALHCGNHSSVQEHRFTVWEIYMKMSDGTKAWFSPGKPPPK